MPASQLEIIVPVRPHFMIKQSLDCWMQHLHGKHIQRLTPLVCIPYAVLHIAHQVATELGKGVNGCMSAVGNNQATDRHASSGSHQNMKVKIQLRQHDAFLEETGTF